MGKLGGCGGKKAQMNVEVRACALAVKSVEVSLQVEEDARMQRDERNKFWELSSQLETNR